MRENNKIARTSLDDEIEQKCHEPSGIHNVGTKFCKWRPCGLHISIRQKQFVYLQQILLFCLWARVHSWNQMVDHNIDYQDKGSLTCQIDTKKY